MTEPRTPGGPSDDEVVENDAFADFDRYCKEHNIAAEDAGAAFAAWMAEATDTRVFAFEKVSQPDDDEG